MCEDSSTPLPLVSLSSPRIVVAVGGRTVSTGGARGLLTDTYVDCMPQISSVQVKGYLAISDLGSNQLSTTLARLARDRKLNRIAAFLDMRALEHALQTVGLSLSDFTVPAHCLVRPLLCTEKRYKLGRGHYVVEDTSSGRCYLQYPLGFSFANVPVLTNTVDQSAVGIAALHHLQSLGHCIRVEFDAFHRSWNDIKLMLRRGGGRLWNRVLQFVVIYNLSYGPFNSGRFHESLSHAFDSFLEQVTEHDDSFTSFLGLMALERRCAPPGMESLEELFQSLAEVKSRRLKGTRAKLSRWFSVFEAAAEHVWEPRLNEEVCCMCCKARAACARTIACSGRVDPDNSDCDCELPPCTTDLFTHHTLID
jgi:hypothetical protein